MPIRKSTEVPGLGALDPTSQKPLLQVSDDGDIVEITPEEALNAPTLHARVAIERLKKIEHDDLIDLCDATEEAIDEGGGFGWLTPPERWKLENFWNGVTLMPERFLWVGRLDDVICSSVQLQRSPKNNEAQRLAGRISGLFVAPWARGFGLSTRLITEAEAGARKLGMEVINLDLRVTQTAAISVMEKLGYSQIGEHPYYAKVDGEWIKGLYYTKRLTRN